MGKCCTKTFSTSWDYEGKTRGNSHVFELNVQRQGGCRMCLCHTQTASSIHYASLLFHWYCVLGTKGKALFKCLSPSNDDMELIPFFPLVTRGFKRLQDHHQGIIFSIQNKSHWKKTSLTAQKYQCDSQVTGSVLNLLLLSLLNKMSNYHQN